MPYPALDSRPLGIRIKREQIPCSVAPAVAATSRFHWQQGSHANHRIHQSVRLVVQAIISVAMVTESFQVCFFLCDLSSSSGLEFRPFFLKPAFSAFLSGNSVSSLASPPTFPFESVSARVSSVAHSWEPGLRHPCMALRYSLNSSAWHQSPL